MNILHHLLLVGLLLNVAISSENLDSEPIKPCKKNIIQNVIHKYDLHKLMANKYQHLTSSKKYTIRIILRIRQSLIVETIIKM